jgi:hypothetical protein
MLYLNNRIEELRPVVFPTVLIPPVVMTIITIVIPHDEVMVAFMHSVVKTMKKNEEEEEEV